jgi:putative copper export protein
MITLLILGRVLFLGALIVIVATTLIGLIWPRKRTLRLTRRVDRIVSICLCLGLLVMFVASLWTGILMFPTGFIFDPNGLLTVQPSRSTTPTR